MLAMVETTESVAAEQAARYYIDTSWFEENGLDFDDVLRERMCDACQAKLGTEVEERQAVFDKKTGRMSFEVKRVPYGSTVQTKMKAIRDDCSKKRNFIQPEMTTLEAVFRVYLANANQPMTLEDVREQLAEWCPGGGCQWLLLPTDTLERLLQNDQYYGLRHHQLPTAV
jgi:hypothetical protein